MATLCLAKSCHRDDYLGLNLILMLLLYICQPESVLSTRISSVASIQLSLQAKSEHTSTHINESGSNATQPHSSYVKVGFLSSLSCDLLRFFHTLCLCFLLFFVDSIVRLQICS